MINGFSVILLSRQKHPKYQNRMKEVLILLFGGGVLCSCTTADTNVRGQANTQPQTQPQAVAPLRPGHK